MSATWLTHLNTLILLSLDTVTAITSTGPAWTTPIPSPGHPTTPGLDRQGRLLVHVAGQAPLRLDPTTFHFTAAHIQVLIDDLAWEPYVLSTPDGIWPGPEVQWATPSNGPDDSPQ